jgi:adenylate kinase
MTSKAPDYENILVMGKSGAGKQPRIDVLVEEYGLKQLSTGDIFRHYLGLIKKMGLEISEADLRDDDGSLASDERIREMLAPYTESTEGMAELLLGVKARYYVNSGLFVPDELVNDLMDDAFGKMGHRGAVLDGYPRTLGQAHYLLELVAEADTRLDLVMLVDNEDELIVKRTIGRRICKTCGKVFHIEYKPPKDGRLCSACGAEVVQRSDDTEDKIWNRLREFHDKVEPTLEFLEKQGIPIAVVSGNLPVFTDEAVRASVLEAIELVESENI